MWQLLAGAGLSAVGSILGARSARKAAQAAANIKAGQAEENAKEARRLAYEYNPSIQQNAEQWSQNVRDQTGQSADYLQNVATGAGTAIRGAAGSANQLLDPYYQRGNQAGQSLYDMAMSKLNAAPAQFTFSENDPSYKWRLQQGEEA